MLIKVLLLFYSWNTSKQHKARTIEDFESCAGNSRESYSVKYCPLLPDHVVPHELHWFLRVMDVLLENVVLQVAQLDVKVNNKQADSLQGAMLQKLLESIQACGVPFQIWRKDSGSSALDWTSLGRAGMRKVLSKLPLFQRHLA